MNNYTNRDRLSSDPIGRRIYARSAHDGIWDGNYDYLVNTVTYHNEMQDLVGTSQRVKPCSQVTIKLTGTNNLSLGSWEEPDHPFHNWAKWSLGIPDYSVPFDKNFYYGNLVPKDWESSSASSFLFNSVLNSCGLRAWASFSQQIPSSYYNEKINRMAILETVGESAELFENLAKLPRTFSSLSRKVNAIAGKGDRAKGVGLMRKLAQVRNPQLQSKYLSELSGLALKWQFDISPTLELIDNIVDNSRSVALAYKAIVQEANQIVPMHYREYNPISSLPLETVIGPSGFGFQQCYLEYKPVRHEQVYNASCVRRWSYPALPLQQETYFKIGLALSDASNPLQLVWNLASNSFILDFFVPIGTLAKIATIPAVTTSYLQIWDTTYSFSEDIYYDIYLRDQFAPQVSIPVGELFARRKIRRIGCPFSNPGAIINGRVSAEMLSILALLQGSKFSRSLAH